MRPRLHLPTALAMLAPCLCSLAYPQSTSYTEPLPAVGTLQLLRDAETDDDWITFWVGQAGRTYFLQNSHDLETWTYLNTIQHGEGPKMHGVASNGNRYFLRLRHTDIPCVDPATADFDGDGLNNADELFWLCDPFLADSDGDGFGDGWEVMVGWDPMQNNATNANLDPDNDGWDNATEHLRGTNPNAVDSDGDTLADPDDADPSDPTIDWPRAPEATRVWIPLDGYNPSTHGAPVALSNTGIALFEKAVWKAGVWKMLEWETEGPELSYPDGIFLVGTTLRAIRPIDLTDDGRVVGTGELIFDDPYGGDLGTPNTISFAVQWSEQAGAMVMEMAGGNASGGLDLETYYFWPQAEGLSPDGVLFTLFEPLNGADQYQWGRHGPTAWKEAPNPTFVRSGWEDGPNYYDGGVFVPARNTVKGGRMGVWNVFSGTNRLLSADGESPLPTGPGYVCGSLSDNRVAFNSFSSGPSVPCLRPLGNIGSWRPLPKLAGTVAFNARGEAISRDGRFWQNGKWLPPVSEGNLSPTGTMHLHDLNDHGVMLATAGEDAGNGQTGIQHGAQAGLLLPIEILPNPIPVTGVARAKVSLMFAEKNTVPDLDGEGGPVMKIGGLPCTDVSQDPEDHRVFYFTPPNLPAQAPGRFDFEIGGITISGCTILSAERQIILENHIEFTEDERRGTRSFLESNIVRWEEATSNAKFQAQNNMISGDDVHALVNKYADPQARDQSGLAKLFFANRSIHEPAVAEYEREIGRLTARFADLFPVVAANNPEYSLPVGVTLVAISGSEADEGETVTIRFTRPEDNVAPLSVSYSLGGTATPGEDYPELQGIILFAEGANHADLVVPMHVDEVEEEPETLIVTLVDSLSYATGYFNKAAITIRDGDESASTYGAPGNPGLQPVSSDTPSVLAAPPQFGPEFFAQAKAMLGRTTKRTVLGTAVYHNPDDVVGKMHYIVFDANSLKLKAVSNGLAEATVENVRNTNPSAEIIINGALFNFKDKEPMFTIGLILNGGAATGTSTDPTKDSYAVAGARYWFGQTLDKSIQKNAGQALSYQFGKGHPPEGAEIDHALGGLISLIFPEGHAQTAQDDADLDNYEAGWFTKPRGDLNKRLRGGVARLVPYNIIGVDRQSGMMVILSKPYKEPILLRDAQQALLASGVDFALVTDGGGSVACWTKDWPHQGGYIAREHRQIGKPDAEETVTSYLIFEP